MLATNYVIEYWVSYYAHSKEQNYDYIIRNYPTFDNFFSLANIRFRFGFIKD